MYAWRPAEVKLSCSTGTVYLEFWVSVFSWAPGLASKSNQDWVASKSLKPSHLYLTGSEITSMNLYVCLWMWVWGSNSLSHLLRHGLWLFISFPCLLSCSPSHLCNALLVFSNQHKPIMAWAPFRAPAAAWAIALIQVLSETLIWRKKRDPLCPGLGGIYLTLGL